MGQTSMNRYGPIDLKKVNSFLARDLEESYIRINKLTRMPVIDAFVSIRQFGIAIRGRRPLRTKANESDKTYQQAEKRLRKD